jgi:hypothetical protein
MKKEQQSSKHSRDRDRHDGERHISNHPGAGKGDAKRNYTLEWAREEHANNFTNRASGNNS